MNLLKTNLSLFAYDPKKDANIAAEMQAIIDKAGGEENLTADDYKALSNLEAKANEKVDYLDSTGTNKWGATKSNKYQDMYASMTTESGPQDNHYNPPNTGVVSTGASNGAETKSSYVPLDTSGVDWDAMYLSPSEYKQVKAYGDAYMAAYNAGDMEKANYYHDLAEGIRANASGGIKYSGGTDGSQFLPFPVEVIPEQQMDKEDIWDWTNRKAGIKPSFDSRWDDMKVALANAYLNMNYEDFLNSDQYQALENRYGLQGKNAMQNILGQIASRTGGLASSYSAQVADQTYNDYMSQLTQAAYDMYRGETSEAYNKAMAAYGFDDADYGMFLEDLAQWNKDRGYAFDVYDAALGQSNYNQEWDYKVSQAEKNDAMDRIQSFLSIGGLAANIDPALIGASGYTQAELQQLQDYYQSILNPYGAGSGSTRYLRASKPAKETPISAGAVEGAGEGALSGMIYVRNGGYYTKSEIEDLIKQGKIQAKTSSDGTVYFDYVFGSGGGNR